MFGTVVCGNSLFVHQNGMKCSWIKNKKFTFKFPPFHLVHLDFLGLEPGEEKKLLYRSATIKMDKNMKVQ